MDQDLVEQAQHGDREKEAVAAAIEAMYADGTMKAIVAKWGLTDAVELLK